MVPNRAKCVIFLPIDLSLTPSIEMYIYFTVVLYENNQICFHGFPYRIGKFFRIIRFCLEKPWKGTFWFQFSVEKSKLHARISFERHLHWNHRILFHHTYDVWMILINFAQFVTKMLLLFFRKTSIDWLLFIVIIVVTKVIKKWYNESKDYKRLFFV